jgi:hypothetical protein
MFRQLPSSGLFLLNYSGMGGLPDDEISLSVLLGSSYYNTKYTVSSLLVLGLSYLVHYTLYTFIYITLFSLLHNIFVTQLPQRLVSYFNYIYIYIIYISESTIQKIYINGSAQKFICIFYSRQELITTVPCRI